MNLAIKQANNNKQSPKQSLGSDFVLKQISCQHDLWKREGRIYVRICGGKGKSLCHQKQQRGTTESLNTTCSSR